MPFWPIVVWPQEQCCKAVLERCSKLNGHLTPSGSTVVGFVPRWAFFLSNGIFSPVTNFLLELEFTKTNKTKTKIEKMFLKTIRFIILKVVLSAEVSRPDICLAATFARTPLYEKRRMALSDLVLRAALVVWLGYEPAISGIQSKYLELQSRKFSFSWKWKYVYRSNCFWIFLLSYQSHCGSQLTNVRKP